MEKRKTATANAVAVGGDNRDRTDDPLLAKQVLSQLSYTPEFWTRSIIHLSIPICKDEFFINFGFW